VDEMQGAGALYLESNANPEEARRTDAFRRMACACLLR
jgi:hypothetical protein